MKTNLLFFLKNGQLTVKDVLYYNMNEVEKTEVLRDYIQHLNNSVTKGDLKPIVDPDYVYKTNIFKK